MATRMKQVQVDTPGEETQGARRATGVASPGVGAASAPEIVGTPDPEVVATTTRRRYTAKYKLQVLEEADRCPPGELGALLRRHGLYSSHLTTWRRQREAGALAALTAVKRGRKARVVAAHGQRVTELERENEHLRQRLTQAETIIEVQKKVSLLLGIVPSPPASGARP
jgi:transposase